MAEPMADGTGLRAGRAVGPFVAHLAGAALFLVGLAHAVPNVWAPRTLFYDEGIVLSHALFVSKGLVPYRDFYSNYPPGIFYLLAAIWKVTGVSGLAARVLALVARVAVVLLAGWLGGRLAGRRFSSLAAGLLACWLVPLELIPAAWVVALCLAFLFLVLASRSLASGTARALAGAGAVLGLLGCMRHDLLCYFCACLVVLGVTVRQLRLPGAELLTVRALLPLAAGAGAVLLPVGLWLLVLARPARVAHDLFLDQVRYVMPGRHLPLPPLFTPASRILAGVEVPLPVFLVHPFPAAVALSLAGPALAALLVCLRRRRSPSDALLAWMLVALALAVLPQMMGRTDVMHALYSVAPALVALAALAELAASRIKAPWLAPLPVLGAVAALVPVWSRLWPLPERLRPPPPERAAVLDLPHTRGIAELNSDWAEARRALVRLVERLSGPDDAVYFGMAKHDRVLVNEADLYFLAQRRPGTRYVQFDPNVVTRKDVQQEMIAQLEQRNVSVVVLSPCCVWDEGPQQELLPGSHLLDMYILRNYAEVERVRDQYSVRVRKQPAGSR
jgi:hypothetical protein